MGVTMIYLTTLSSRWKLATSKASNLKATTAAECAAELLNWLQESRASIKSLICLCITYKYFCHNMVATIMAVMVAAILTR